MTNFEAVDEADSKKPKRNRLELFAAQRLNRQLALRWIFVAVLGFLAAQIISAGLLYAVAALKGESSKVAVLVKLPSPPQWTVLSSLLGLWMGFLAAPIVAVRMDGSKRTLGFSFKWSDGAGIGIGIVSQFLIGLAYRPFIKHIKDFSGPVHKLAGSSHGFGLWVIAVLTVVGAPIAEELFFRGLLYRGLEGAIVGGAPTAYLVSSIAAVALDGVLFGAAHLELAQFAGLAFFGIVLATCFRLSGRLGLSVVSHATFNALAMVSLVTSGSIVWHLW